jgi:hypothetical protein
MPPSLATRPLRARWSGQGKKNLVSDLTLSADYVNGTGWAISKQQLGFASGDTIDFVDVEGSPAGYLFAISRTATGIMLRVYTTAATEAATNLAGLNGIVVRLLATGN